MEYLEKAKKYTWFSTCIDFVCLIFSIIVSIVLTVSLLLYDPFHTTENILENAQYHDLTGGYEVIGGLFVGILESFALLVFILLLIILIIQVIFFLISVITGIVSLHNFNKGKYTFKIDAIVKLIFHIIPCLVVMTYSIDQNTYTSLVLVIPHILVIVLSILTILNMNKFKLMNA